MSRRVVTCAAIAIAIVLGIASSAVAYFTASATASQLVTSSTLGAPASISSAATGATGLTVSVNGTGSSPMPTGYAVYPHGSTSSPSCTISSSSGSCAVTGLTAGTTTSYDVYSTLGNWISAGSGAISGTTTPAKPTGVVFAGTGYVGSSNKSSAEVDVTLPSTSTTSDTVHVTISDGTTMITVPVKAGTSGAGTVAFTGVDLSTLHDGPLTITAWSSDAGGSSVVLTTAAVKDTAGPSPTVTTPASGSYVSSTTPTISGAAGTQAADASHSADSSTVTVKIYAGATATGTALQTISGTVSSGTWTAMPTALTGNAQYTVQVTQTDAAGNVGTSTATSFVIDTTAPVVTLTAPTAGSITTTVSPTFSGNAGTLTANSTRSADGSSVTVKVYAGATATGTPAETLTATVGTGGAWSVQANPALTSGQQYTVVASQTDGAGNTGASSAVTFTASAIDGIQLVNPQVGCFIVCTWTGQVALVDSSGHLTANTTGSAITVTVTANALLGSSQQVTIAKSATTSGGYSVTGLLSGGLTARATINGVPYSVSWS